MKTFRFSLNSIHELRHSEEQAAQKTFADTIRAFEQAEVRLVMMDRSLQNMWQEMRNSTYQVVRADQMRHAHSWGIVLEEQQKQLATELAACQRQVDAAHELLKAATQKREALDRLLLKQRRTHDKAVQHEDQKFLDELATRGAWRGAAQLEAA
jgi:flagellar export protein FliJ